eukprot:60751-Pelagomonas_calceolata.AAC.1
MEHPGKHPVRDASISCQGPSLAVPHAMDCSMWPLTIRACTEETKIKTSVVLSILQQCLPLEELSVYNPRQEEALELRNGLIAMVVVMALILSGGATEQGGKRGVSNRNHCNPLCLRLALAAAAVWQEGQRLSEGAAGECWQPLILPVVQVLHPWPAKLLLC